MKNQDKLVKIFFEPNLRPKPEPHELSAARIIAEYYETEILFLRRGIDKTADFKFGGRVWELKSPRGNSKRTIENNLRDASQQSQNIIIDLSRAKMRTNQAIARAKYYVRNERNRHIKRIIIISREGKVFDIL